MLRPQSQQESDTINICYPNPFPKWFTHNLRLNKYSLEEILNNEEAAQERQTDNTLSIQVPFFKI